MTVAEYFEAWAVGTVAHQVTIGELRESTADNYLDIADRMIVPHLGRHRLDELKPVHLREGLATLRRTPSSRGTLYSARTVQRRRTSELAPSGRRRGHLVEVETKTVASVRTVALPGMVVEALAAHRATQDLERASAPVWVNPPLVFTTHLGTWLDPRNVYGFWHALCDRAGVRRCRPHDLRHTAASVLLPPGTDMCTAMEVVGHSRRPPPRTATPACSPK